MSASTSMLCKLRQSIALDWMESGVGSSLMASIGYVTLEQIQTGEAEAFFNRYNGMMQRIKNALKTHYVTEASNNLKYG